MPSHIFVKNKANLLGNLSSCDLIMLLIEWVQLRRKTKLWEDCVSECLLHTADKKLDRHNINSAIYPHGFLVYFTDTVCMFIPDAIEGLAALVLWFLLYLCHNPEMQAKCQREVYIFDVNLLLIYSFCYAISHIFQ